MFYNTTSIKGEELKKAWEDAKTQEQRVRLIVAKKGPLTASEALDWYQIIYGPILITSVRRCLCDLSNYKRVVKDGVIRFREPHIENTRKTKPGPWGKPEFLFKAI